MLQRLFLVRLGDSFSLFTVLLQMWTLFVKTKTQTESGNSFWTQKKKVRPSMSVGDPIALKTFLVVLLEPKVSQHSCGPFGVWRWPWNLTTLITDVTFYIAYIYPKYITTHFVTLYKTMQTPALIIAWIWYWFPVPFCVAHLNISHWLGAKIHSRYQQIQSGSVHELLTSNLAGMEWPRTFPTAQQQ